MRALSRAASAAIRRLSSVLVDAVLRIAAALVAAARTVREWLSRIPGRLAALAAAIAEQGLAALWSLDPRGLLAWLRRLLLSLYRDAATAVEERTTRDSTGSTGSDRAPLADEEQEAEAAPATRRELWREFVRIVAPPSRSSRTPGEIARYAIDRGLPEQPVRQITEAYRDAEYGGRPPSDGRLDDVRDEVAELRGDDS